MITIKEESCFYYLGLVIGLFSRNEIITWADKIITESKFKYPYEIIDISLSGNRSTEDVASLLKSAYGSEKLNEPLYRMLGY